MRTLRVKGQHQRPPYPQAGKPEQGWKENQATMGTSNGGTPAQNPRGLSRMPCSNPQRNAQQGFTDMNHWRAVCIERCTHGSEGGGWKRVTSDGATSTP